MGYYSSNRGKKPLRLIEKESFASGEWKCPGSATGGHWWNCNVVPHTCKFCGKVKADPR